MSNEALISDLAAGLAPVRRRSIARETLMLLALGATELALVLGVGAMRHDMGMMIGSAYMLWRMGSLAVLAGISCAVALRSFAPPAAPRRGVAIVLALAGLAMIGGAFVDPAGGSGRSLLDRLAPADGLV
jgi:hypothetical protein